MGFTIPELWGHMGWFARGVVITMAFMSVTSTLVFLERLLVFRRQRRDSVMFAKRMTNQLHAEFLDQTADALQGIAKVDGLGYLGRVIGAGLDAFGKAPKFAPEFTLESTARALEKQSQREVASLKRGHGILVTIAGTAPFVGLLGTTVGIVNAFQLMADAGSGGLATISAGIAEALVTTAFGLFVAIPAVAAANYVQAWVDGRSVDIAESATEFLDEVSRRLKALHAQTQMQPQPAVVQAHQAHGHAGHHHPQGTRAAPHAPYPPGPNRPGNV